MKKNFILLFLSASIIFFGCREKIVTVEAEKNTNKGGLLFKIDKVNAPKNVVMVEAILSRTDFDTVKASLNLVTETSADLALNNIPIGAWQLNVNAYDSLQAIVYAGETVVNVQDGIITQVNLTLIPTSSGLGSIYIYVNWGKIPTTAWNDFELNPILPSPISSTPPLRCNQPKVLYDDGKFKMWFATFKYGFAPNTGYAESYDGFAWNVVKENLFDLQKNDSSSYSRWDANCVIPGAVIKENGIYKMYYVGFINSSGEWHIGLAESKDGISWERYPEPVLKANSTEYQISAGDIIKINGVYFLYYSFRYNTISTMPVQFTGGISLATSTDGKTWKRSETNPILTKSQGWEVSRIYYPSVIVENDRYDMMYMDGSGTGFGMASSKDGYTWTKTTTRPIFTLADTKGAKAYEVVYPFCRKINNKYFLYYSSASNSDMLTITIRVAVK
ncbi:MAG: hypothetical protein COZ80_11815 [Ignavibacteria bacterium CG_4_8_14_3_um_filter_37_9]|nr:hypothetical protein [Ignavibacteria bacterium]OIO14543.1 MAG: hypothetical protein AUJ54_14010 [Ignavibacteria bacterium CG1_02_37_35]PIP77244.1 MAG: hypothetical protein COW85_10015 [Ignavibacteria bacterium CG22_combo_CG10-13_8_21_14_all_37_15]PIS45070.1 MAG: hypothetical protein COT22_07150 [Ignavibacteria bacterium CG08_land_8_20_14_0_20_37_9]PIW98198.1 MAG: hypothetical protein COZ80_11815 [Ignavibacteria bacterium CG_4_8_14_3_um_filter_37_9]PIX93843.1 MAG: hypothetical protein COZ25_